MAKIKGICNNFDEGCQFCLDRTVQEKEKTEPFECKGCGKSLFLKNGDDSRDGDGINGKLIAIIAGILIVLGVGGFFFIGNKNEPEPQKTEQPQPVAVSGITIDKTSLSFDATGKTAQLTATILPDNAADKTVTWQSSDEKVATVSETGLVKAVAAGNAEITAYTGNGVSASCKVTVNGVQIPPPTPTPTPTPTLTTKTYPCGKYAGSLKNGIPEGDGTMTYTRRVQIAKHDTQNPPHYAEAGDKFVGSWGNGDIVSGTLYGKDGAIKEKIFAPKRFNHYDISKDCN